MSGNGSMKWPPIIEFARAPWYVRVRDVIFTIIAWSLLLFLVRNGIAVLIDYFSDPIFELTRTDLTHLDAVWERLQMFLMVSLCVMLWLGIWGVIHRRQLRLFERVTPPARLALERHAASFQLDPEEVERWRDMKIAVVQFDSDNRIASVTAGTSHPVQPL